jgi:NADH dehydrogenase
MILITGGTGFVGQVLIRHLVELGLQVRILLRPSPQSPNLPRGVPVEAVICGLRDERGLRAAMKGVDFIFHLAGAETKKQADLMGVDIEGTRTIVTVAADAGVDRFVFLSHLGADRASAYPVLKAKAIAENIIIRSGIDFTIFRSAVLYGPGDQFTTELARLLRLSPGFFFLPGGGETLLQPLWVEDLVTCLTLVLDDLATKNQVIAVGGPEYLSLRQIVETLLAVTGLHRLAVPVSPAHLRILAILLEHSFNNFPMSIFWHDYLAEDRTCDLDTIPRLFGLLPERFGRQLDYLAGEKKRRAKTNSALFAKYR